MKSAPDHVAASTFTTASCSHTMISCPGVDHTPDRPPTGCAPASASNVKTAPASTAGAAETAGAVPHTAATTAAATATRLNIMYLPQYPIPRISVSSEATAVQDYRLQQDND